MDKNSFKKFLNRLFGINEIRVVIPLIVVIVIFGVWQPAFFSFINLRAIIRASSFHGIIILGMTYSFIVRQPDLSIGSIAGFAAIISSICIVWIGWPVWVGITLALIVAALIGLINGFLTVKLKIPPIVATLGMLFLLRGLTFVISKGLIVYPFPDYVYRFAKFRIIGLPISFVIFLILAILLDFVLRKTTFGRKVYATGANVRVAQLMGINTNFIKMITHVQLGVLCAIGGILYMFNMGNGTPSIGLNWEFPVIVGVIIGGVSILGGVGTVLSAFFGVLIIQVLYNGLTIVGIKGIYENIIIGVIMLVVAGLDTWRRTKIIKVKAS